MNILEVLPKDKKSKEEKTAILGQASLDLLPALLGDTHTSPLTLTLHTVTEVGGAPSSDSIETVSEHFKMTIVFRELGSLTLFRSYVMHATTTRKHLSIIMSRNVYKPVHIHQGWAQWLCLN